MHRWSPEDSTRGRRAASPNGISHANHDGERKMVMIFDHNDEEDVCVQQGINENRYGKE